MPRPKISGVFAKLAGTSEESTSDSGEVEPSEAKVEDDLSFLTEGSQETSSDPEEPEASQEEDQAEAELAETAYEDRDPGQGAIDEADNELETEPESELETEPESELETEPESELESGEEPMSNDAIENQENSPAEPVKDEQTPSPEPVAAPTSLSVTLDEVFQKRKTRDPLIQALLDEHGEVDVQDLASDLRKLAGEFGVGRD